MISASKFEMGEVERELGVKAHKYNDQWSLRAEWI
jgi:hypothetical protein